MKTVPDDILLPCGWVPGDFREDRMEFRRDDDRFVVSARRTEECPPLPGVCSSQCWELRCRQRAGEAANTTTIEYVTTRETALETLLTYMQRLTEAIGSEGGLTPSSMIDTLGRESTIGRRDRWRRPPAERTDVHRPSP